MFALVVSSDVLFCPQRNVTVNTPAFCNMDISRLGRDGGGGPMMDLYQLDRSKSYRFTEVQLAVGLAQLHATLPEQSGVLVDDVVNVTLL